ncbi:hypothetical protein M9H77_19418 [Catharanthus roseus]|uniref:Uncharacterized protein n=1 Tax=Catharanthus roseus TaxID=4058 RepID=A0ACC0BAB0_CATRO|nr:hypothetical protein M9H77_19418 [Catharanthus roseus]
MKIRLTLLPVPETRIGDLTMYIPSRGLIQGSLELFFFQVIVIIRFRLTKNGIISVRPVNLIVIIITALYNVDGSSETICVTAVICSDKVVVFLSCVLGIFYCWIDSNSTRI